MAFCSEFMYELAMNVCVCVCVCLCDMKMMMDINFIEDAAVNQDLVCA